MKPGINRRQFMQHSLVGAAAAPLVARTVAHAAEEAESVSPNDRIQMGIIGVGARVQSGVMQAAVAQPGVEIVGVCDAYTGRVERAIERTGGQAKDYGDWRSILADESIDAVIIGTPDHWHKEQTLEALAAGKDVYLEKPMTLTIDEGPAMIAAAEKSDRILQIGSNGMSSYLQQTAREIVKSGKLGRITLIRATYDRNTDSGSLQSVTVIVVNPDSGDVETITLTETGNDTGVFRNTAALPSSTTGGQLSENGTLYAIPGNTLQATYTDPIYGDGDSDTAVIALPVETKPLYLSEPGQGMDRVDPVATGGRLSLIHI